MDPVKSQPSTEEKYRPPKAQQIDPSLFAYRHPSGSPITADPSGHIQYDQQKNPEHVPDYFILSIFTTFCCCYCLGIFAGVASNQAYYMRFHRPEKAKEKANLSRNLNILAVICGVILYIYAFLVLKYPESIYP